MPSKFIGWHGQHTSDERRQSRKNQVRQFIRLLLSLPTSRRGFACARHSCAARAILLTLTASSVSEQAEQTLFARCVVGWTIKEIEIVQTVISKSGFKRCQYHH